jgi:hypothetical protein
VFRSSTTNPVLGAVDPPSEGEADGLVVGKAVGPVVGPVVGKAVGPVVGKAVGPVVGLTDGDADNASLASVLVLLPLDFQMLSLGLLLLLEPLGPLETMPFIIPVIIIPLLLTPCLDLRVRRFPFELTDASPLPPVTRRSSRTAVRALECMVIRVKRMR